MVFLEVVVIFCERDGSDFSDNSDGSDFSDDWDNSDFLDNSDNSEGWMIEKGWGYAQCA